MTKVAINILNLPRYSHSSTAMPDLRLNPAGIITIKNDNIKDIEYWDYFYEEVIVLWEEHSFIWKIVGYNFEENII